MTQEKIDPEFIELDLNGEDYQVAGFGQPVRFAKLLTVRFPNGDVVTSKLSYTRELSDGTPTSKPVPCVRIDGEKIFLDADSGMAVAQDCVAFVE